jgi:putative cardiolipin synthase
VQEVVKQSAHRLSYESLKQQLDEHYKRITVQNYLDLTSNSQAIDSLMSRDIPLDWVKAEVVKDSPDKIKSKAKRKNTSISSSFNS